MRKRGRGAMIAVFLVALLIFGTVWSVWTVATTIFEAPPLTNTSNHTITLTIQEGESTQQIADDLEAKGLVRSALAFRLWARIKGLDKTLEAGIYILAPGMTIDQIIARLQNGQPDEKRLAVIEGTRLEEIANAASQSGLQRFDKQQFLQYVKHPETFPDRANYPILQQIPQGQSMEGLLFPDTYQMPVNYDAVKVIDSMLNEFTQQVQNNHLDTLAQKNGLTTYQMIILASIVQREVRFTNDMPQVASVYWNRVQKPNAETRGLLGADPTVQYARDTDNPPAKYWQPLKDVGGQIDAKSPWNTYNTPGWPPTPIASPGLKALLAAASPAQTNYYFFLSKPDGHNVYEATYAQFLKDVHQYLPS
ncbi:MAG: endolytic transglycosylase MltG [Ktedonobacteraceae bacterium]